jgi:GGDEF domain-containing protein
VDQATRELEQRLQRAPTGAEVAAAANLTEEGIEELLAARQTAQVVRIQGAVREDDEEFLEVDPEKFHSKEYVTLELPWEDKIALESALDRLKELEQKVLYSFFFQEFNQSEIARQLGISCNYVGYLLRNGLKHMRDGYPDDPTQAAATADPGSTGSVVDPETGLYTQEYLHRRLAEEMSRAQRSEHCVSVCVLQLPPRLPAPKLREAVRVLRSRMRRGDIPARSGARELAVIFLKTGSVADRVASRLADTLAEALGEPVTFGSATFPGDGRTAAAMLVTARRAPDERHPASPLGGSETDLPMVTHLALSSA